MTRTVLLAAALAVLPFAASAVQGQQQPQQPKPVSRLEFTKTLDTRFNQLDGNHDGKITKEELAAELQREMQQANARIAQQLEARFRQLDTNHDGQLSLKEFMAAQPGIHPNESPDQMLQRLDTNHDGKITPPEFKGPDLAKFNAADTNHDGVVTPAEAQAYARAHAAH
jgi:hypothetical protein